jgi:VanZ family protein
MSRIRSHTFVILVYLVYGAGILWLSLTPAPPHMPGVWGWDKLQHAGAFALMTFLGGMTFGSAGRAGSWLLSAAIAVLFGGAVEVLQGTVTISRSADWLDFLADIVGSLFVVTCALLAMKIKGNNR